MSAVVTQELVRVYKGRDRKHEVVALDSVSLQIEEGEVFGLLGPNGAGKTTLVKVLSTVLLPTRGTATILGHDVVVETKTVRKLIGIVFGGDRGLYPWISARHNLNYWAALYNVPGPLARDRVERLLERVGLADRADDKVEGYSRGMKQRLHLARGLVSGARVLFLDEPTTGMDPVAARDFRELIRDLKGEGCTILLTTHDMAEAESVCDRVALIDRGKLLATETPRSLGRIIAEHERIDCEGVPAETVDYVRGMLGVSDVQEKANGGCRILMSDSEAIPRVIQVLAEAGVASINTSRPSLEEVYLHIIGDRGLKV